MSQATARSRSRALSGAGYMLLGASLIRWSAAIVAHVFGQIGPSATSAWRFFLGALVLLAFMRPRLRAWTRLQWFGALALGVSVAFINQCFCQAIARITLGAAVAIEYLGPFMVSALGKRSAQQFAFVVFTPGWAFSRLRPGARLNDESVLFAAGSGVGWAGLVPVGDDSDRHTIGPRGQDSVGS